MSQTKQCRKCGQVKSIVEFGVDRSRPDGRGFKCYECLREIWRVFRETHRVKISPEELHERRSAAAKRRQEKHHATYSEAVKRRFESATEVARASDRTRRMWDDPDVRSRIVSGIRSTGQSKRSARLATILAAGEKLCSRCSTIKPLDDFAPHARKGRQYQSDVLRSACKVCEAEDQRKRMAAMPIEEKRARKRATRLRNPDSARRISLRRTLRKWGYSSDQIPSILLWVVEHGPLCDVCGRHYSDSCSRSNRLHVDHDHESGAIQGMVCNLCNTSLKQDHRNAAWLGSALEYVIRSPKFCLLTNSAM